MFSSTSVRAFLLMALGSVYIGAAVESDSIVQDINNYQKLTKEQKQSLVSKVGYRQLRQLPPKKRAQIQRACLRCSENLIGKDARGKQKVVRDDAAKLILKTAGDYLKTLPVGQTPAHSKAGEIYGEIPKGTKYVDRTVSIDPSVVRWHSTGLYAVPGEIVTLTFPESWVGKNLKVKISGHRDNISVKKNLMRLPTRPARSFPVTQKTVKVAAPFGGAIYIDTGNRQQDGEPFPVKISHAIEAPYFVLGKTKVSDWNNTIRAAPAPYAELVTDRIALSFPSAWIRDLKDPTALLQYWDKVVALHDELGGMAHTRFGPERVNVDIQISVGLFHAGYPAQGPQKQCRGVVDLEKLKTRGNWGWFHEMGHEAQRRPDKAWGWNNPYTFDGSIEVTVNLFSAHAMDRMKMQDRGGWSWTASPDEVVRRAHKTLSSKKKYPEMGAGEKLAMFLQLRDKFGWKTIQTVLAGYTKDQDAKPGVLPKTNQAKRDAFLIRMSQATGHNLTPFMQDIWGIPMSAAAVEKVKLLPVWTPEGFKKYL